MGVEVEGEGGLRVGGWGVRGTVEAGGLVSRSVEWLAICSCARGMEGWVLELVLGSMTWLVYVSIWGMEDRLGGTWVGGGESQLWLGVVDWSAVGLAGW